MKIAKLLFISIPFNHYTKGFKKFFKILAIKGAYNAKYTLNDLLQNPKDKSK